MQKQTIEKRHYSLAVILSSFVILVSTFLIINLYEKDNNTKSDITTIDYDKIDTINPLVLDDTNNELNKKDANVKLIHEIKRVYNLDVSYGKQAQLLANSVSATSLYEEEEVYDLLKKLINCLEKYPNNIFKEIMLKDYNVQIYIVDYFDDDNIALATRDSNNDFKIYLSNNKSDEKIERAVHHEIYHVLEYYMKLEYDINELYKDWESYNPENFEYLEDVLRLDSNYVYGLDNINVPYFVTIYSKYSVKEDRAETFASTMIAKDKPAYYNSENSPIKNKISLISNNINSVFYSAKYGVDAYWMKFF